MYELILKGGRIYDGSGLPSFLGDVAISNGRRDLISVKKVVCEENKDCEELSIAELANEQHKSPIDAMLDLALSEDLETTFEDSTTQGDEQAVKEIFCNPNVMLGQSDAGAHVANGNPGFGFSTLMLA